MTQATLPNTPPKPAKKRASKPRAKKSTAVPLESYQQLVDAGLPATLAEPLFCAVSLSRASQSITEAQFVGWLIGHVSKYAALQRIDVGGNVHFSIPRKDGVRSKTLFVAHTDTVHSSGGGNEVLIDGKTLKAGPTAECLGADNAAGVSMMVHLMANKVPGTYVFTRQEECGGVGATALADNYGQWLRMFDRAITFDRRGTSDVITHQGGARCASDNFGWALADALNDAGLLYMPSDRGVYTDTKEFVGHISECTNISVGYSCEHGPSEELDLTHYAMLAKAAVKLRWEALPTERNVKVVEYKSSQKWSSVGGKWARDDKEDLETDWQFALEDLVGGYPRLMTKLLAREMSPDNPQAAERFLDVGRLTEEDCMNASKLEREIGVQYLLAKASLFEKQ